ncbi:hypothetical protein AA0113_g12184 [Alternaria arborescens]|uniref:Uncharacterized protein n=1 Tax=Alternaria arborescens TaxID=156630 RepID=A0A4Q4PYI1_9PLEO|nr:hypothetical protein AA0111_g12226 [Alternaria arborescens]RYN17423.1 hypothetical protein AA0112_g12070 [Alternaria arborescens]RYO13542.1 hypothetical protein AA0111_g12226 [Alternaria arborescens]RYO28407.1 hypothetical protein AA0113_g12184 [Alternaria arborescens]
MRLENIFAEKMSSSDKRDTQRRLERVSMPPRISTSFPRVNLEGYLAPEKSQLLPSPSKVPISSPRKQKNKKVDQIFYGSEHTQDTNQKPRRRADIEEQIRQDPYHTLFEGGNLPRDLDVIDEVDTNVQRLMRSEYLSEESPNTQQSRIVAPGSVRDKLVETPRPPMASVLCGRQDPESWYLTRRLIRMPGNDDDDLVSLLKRRNIDSDAAEIHRLWRHTGIIPTCYRDINFDPDGINPQHTWIACWPLMNAAIHGYMLEDIEFVDRVMDLLEDKIVKGVRPDDDTISHLFGENRHHVPMMLQHFLVDRWVDHSTRGFEDVDPHSLPDFFICAALDTAIRRLSHMARQPSSSGCQYHTHPKSVECYRNRNKQTEAMKQGRYKYCREKASREAEKAAADSIKYGIATVDWEARRVEAHRALHDQVDDYSPTASSWMETSGRAVEGIPLEQVDRTYGAPAPERENPESHLNFGSSSMFGTTRVDSAADEVKVAPPAREPPPPPPTDMPVDDPDSTIESIKYAEIPKEDKKSATSAYDDAMPFVKSEGDFESIPSDATAVPPEVHACAQATSPESTRRKKRATCPGSFPESRSGSLKENITM